MASPRPSLARERALWCAGGGLVAGMDEVGRGPLAGPVGAAAVVFPLDVRPLRGLRDSKLLTAARRESLAGRIRSIALAVGVGAASVHEIDRVNIRRATVLAMRRALARLSVQPQHLLIDGLPIPDLGLPHQAIVDGDVHCHSIAAASIIAKVVRDRLMQRLDQRYPRYGWGTNRGYGTEEHLAAIDRFGPTPHHRYSFEPVSQLRFA